MKSLSPLLVFLTLYLGFSLSTGDFYCMPLTVAFAVASVWAVGSMRSVPTDEALNIFSRGAGNANILLMVWIFVLSGAFAASAKAMGAVEQTVNLTMCVLPANMLLPGIFVAACFVSLSIGTSVGTIASLTPIAAGIATETGMEQAMAVAAVVGGAFFGDNLSFISDTTIIATRSQGCRMSDKFRVNLKVVTPAAVLCLVLYVVIGANIDAHGLADRPVDWLLVMPYVLVLLTVICGMNVLVVLLSCIALTGIIGIFKGCYDFTQWMQVLSSGIADMGELILITMMAGGIMETIRHNGGFDFIINSITRRVHSKRGAEMSIGLMVMAADLCTANNTVAIVTVGPIARSIARRFDIDPRKAASLLDTFSCLAQSMIPYGAQLLMAAGLSSLSPVALMPYLFYPMLMGCCVLSCILFRLPRNLS